MSKDIAEMPEALKIKWDESKTYKLSSEWSFYIYYLIVYPLKLFYTSQCERSDKERNDPAEILLIQCF